MRLILTLPQLSEHFASGQRTETKMDLINMRNRVTYKKTMRSKHATGKLAVVQWRRVRVDYRSKDPRHYTISILH